MVIFLVSDNKLSAKALSTHLSENRVNLDKDGVVTKKKPVDSTPHVYVLNAKARVPVGRLILELPAGMIDGDGADIVGTAVREVHHIFLRGLYLSKNTNFL